MKQKKKKTKAKTLKWEISDSWIETYSWDENEVWVRVIKLWKKNAITFWTWIEPMYKTPSAMLQVIKKYFEWWYRKKTIVDRYWYHVEVAYMTITDLCIFLGFDSRNTLYKYETKEIETMTKEWVKVVQRPFEYIIKRAKLFIEREYEELLRENPAAAMFALRTYFKWEWVEWIGWLPFGAWWGDNEEKVVYYLPDNWRVKNPENPTPAIASK